MNKILLTMLTAVFFLFNACLSASTAQPKTVLVVGGAGYIGSHVNKDLQKAGYQTVVLDNLKNGNIEAVPNSVLFAGDMGDADLLDKIFSSYQIDIVMNFAALKNVGESMSQPLKYYVNNISSTLTLLDAMIRHNVKKLIFSSSSAIFGSPQCDSISEDTPCMPINPYGQSKLMMEAILKDLDRTFGLRFSALRYFNVAGGDPEGILKNYQVNELNLIPVVLRCAQNQRPVTVFGTDCPTPDGSCIRDYIHVEDLSQAHIAVMEKMFEGAPSNFYNLGNGKGYSVLEVIAAAEKVTGKKIDVILSDRRAGDPAILLANPEKANRELNWHPQYSALEVMVEHAWNAMQY